MKKNTKMQWFDVVSSVYLVAAHLTAWWSYKHMFIIAFDLKDFCCFSFDIWMYIEKCGKTVFHFLSFTSKLSISSCDIIKYPILNHLIFKRQAYESLLLMLWTLSIVMEFHIELFMYIHINLYRNRVTWTEIPVRNETDLRFKILEGT